MAAPVTLTDRNGVYVDARVALPMTAAATVNRSATVGTTATTAMPANASRKGWKIKNDTAEAVHVNFVATAAVAAGAGNIRVAAGALLTMCALLLGGYSQYAAQDQRSGPIPAILSYAAMGFIIAAIGVFWGRG